MSSIAVRRVVTAALTAALVLMQVPSSLWPQLAAHAPTTAQALDADAALLARFAVGNEPVSAAVNTATDRVYVATRGATSLDNGAVAVVSGADNTVVASVPVGRSPSRVLVNESTNRIYVLHGGEATYKVIDGTTNAVTATIPATSSGAFDGALDAGRARLYLTHNNNLTVFSTDTNTQVGQVDFLAQGLTGAAFGVAVNRATNTIYVIRARTNAAGQGFVSVIDGATLAVTANIDVGLWPELLDVNESTGRVYVASETGPVKVIDGSTNAVIATIALADGAAGLSVDPGRDRLYVAIEGGNRLAVIDTAADANTVLVQVPTGGQFPQDAAVNTASDRVYLPNFGTDDLSVVGAPALLPDLVVSNVTVTPSVTPGGTVTYSWRVTNQGTGTATASAFSWGDQAWISTSATSIAGAYPAGGIVAPNSLAPGASYDRTFSATVGAIPPGSYFFIIQTDNGNQIGESNEGNNLSAGVPITVTTPVQLAYIYKTDTVSRDAWSTFLSTRGYAVTAMTEAAAETADFSPYRAILVGSDTGDGDPRTDPWGTPAQVANITRSGKPIIGLGDGGAKFLDAKAGGTSTIGWLSSWIVSSADGVIVVDGSAAAWTTPNATGLATGAAATLYSAPSTTIAVFAPAAVTGVTRIGRQTDDLDHYPVIRQGCDVHWGFTGSAASLTLTGKDLFDNLLAPCAPAPRLAYVYKTDTAARDAWVAFLSSRGYAVDALTETAAGTADLSPYRAILVANDTGDGDPRTDPWGTPAIVANIAGAGKPIIGLGDGGSKFFDAKAGGTSKVGWLQSWIISAGTDSVVVVDGADAPWTTPNATGLATGATATLYSTPNATIAVFAPATVTGVTRIGRQTDDADHYPVIREGCDVHWGFSGSASSLTSAGRQVFENLLDPCAVRLVTVSAEVREDLDRDGTFDAGEPFLTAPRLEVFRVNGDGSRTPVGAAVNSPNLSVSGIESGVFDIVETDPAGYVSTSPNTVRVTVNAGSSLTRFMDARDGVSGTARHRETPDGTTIVDVVLGGATVTLLKPDGTKARVTAAADGSFAFPALAPNTAYTVGYDGTAGIAPNDRHYVTGVRFTTDASGGAYVPAPQAVFNRGNHTWLSALPLGNNVPIPDQVWRRGQATWYRFAITPQQSVTIELTNCPFNCDLVVYKDLRQVQAKLLADAQTQAGIRLSLSGDVMADDLDADDLDADDLDADDLDADDLDADDLDADDLDADDLDADDLDADDLDADDLDADDLDADDLDADDLDADDLDADDLDADDLDADDLDADDLDADDLDADDLDADDLDADDLDADDLDAAESATYVAAQRKGLRAASLTPGLANETVVINTRDLTGDLYIRVAGGSSLSGIFTINARRTTDASCLTAPLVSRQPSTTFGAAAVGKRSLILTDTGVRGYGLDTASRAAFLTTLGTFASHPTVQGQVVDLADDAGIQQLRADWASARTCVAQANLVTDAIREVVQRFKTASGGSFEYLVNAGGDSVIPFRRVADWAEISRESRYNPPLAALTASEASLVADTFLNDDFYVASPIDGPNRTLYLPEAAVGRLVESVADVTAYIAMYLAADGVAAPTSALSSGYDFNLDLADYVTSQLSLRGLAVDSSLVSNTWSSADWRAKVLERAVTDAFGILSLQGHFSANRLVPADNGQRVLSSELAAITDGRFLKALVYSLGCHSGYSIVDADGTILTQVDAFPEVFVRKGATVVAGTGYQYGETILMKNTEALIALLTDELGYSTSPTGASYAAGVPIGKALMQAKRAYMAQTATPRGIDLKVVGVSTVYGSPTMAFRLPSQQARPGSGTLAPAPVSGFAGLTALDVATSDTLTPVTSGGGTYYTANGATTTAPYRPIAPLSTIDANVAGSVLQGAVFLGGAYTETAGFTPRLSIPATELAGDAPRYANDVFMPVIPVRTNLFDGDALQVVPFQYRSNADGTSGTARVFGGGVQVRAFWSSVTGPSAAADAPAIRDVLLDLDSQGRLVVVATLRGVLDPGIAEVWLTYTDATAAARSFASVAMVPVAGAPGNIVPDAFGQGFTRLYTATLSGDPAKYRFLLQAVSGNGRVSAATNNGELYRFVPVSLRPTPPAPTVDTRVASALALSAPSSATYRSTITATVTLTGAGQALGGKTVTFAFGGSTRSAVTGTNGVATATLDVNVTPRSAPYTLTASFAGDTTAHGSSASANVTVGRAPTLLQAITASPQYSDGAAVARLTSGGLTLNEQAVVITRGAVSVATFTDFAGDVRFDTIDFGAGAGTSTLTIEYPGNDRYGPSSLTADVPVLRENATLALTQPGPQPTGAITFTAQVAQAADGSLGDLRRATVDFTFTPASGSPVSASSAADASGGASVTVTLPAGLYEVTAQVTGDFTSEVVAIAVPVYDASAFVSGGGYLTTGTDSLGVPLGVRANFGFVAEYGVDGTTATGDLNLHVKSRTGKDNDTDAQARANGSLKFKATSFEWLVIAGNGAAFTGTGTVNGVAGYQFRADVVDDGSSDLFVIHIWDADSTYAAPDHIVRGTLGGGNIRIHR